MSVNTSQYEYQKLDRSKREVRLLKLLPKDGNEKLKLIPACHLFHATLHEKPKFVALSYVWGATTNLRVILVDNTPFRVTQNLYDAMMVLTYHNKEVYEDFSDRLRAAARTSIGGVGYDQDRQLARVGDGRFLDAVMLLRDNTKYIKNIHIKVELQKLLANKGIKERIQSEIMIDERLGSEINGKSLGRLPFIIRKGNLALSSDYVEQGDYVALIKGTQVPFVLRRQCQGQYKLISEAYVDVMAKRILLTGANGFVGSHILDQLLGSGFSVRAIVRSEAKSKQVLSDFPNYGSQLDFGIVPDITTSGAFDTAVQANPPFDAVVHTASPFLYRVISNNREFLDPAIKGTLEILKSIKAHAPTVKRVVITSSCAAVVNFAADPIASPQKIYTEEDWNPTTWEGALTGTQNSGYQASKKFAEKSAWDFVETEKPNFDLVTLTPPMVYGPIRHSVASVKQLNESNSRIWKLFIDSSKDKELPPNGMHVYVDVRDLALAHVKAVTLPEASNQRFIICQGQVTSQNISDILRSSIPELEERTPKGTPGGNPLSPNAYTCSSSRAEKVLGLKFRSKEETFVDLAKQLLAIEKEEQ
ncbi:hypothetical protein B7494_g2866 [Chlorociboria aeruginascens]|nr:hypothetical protein B7494_g2866 [Chlorociboria aeruginascens]